MLGTSVALGVSSQADFALHTVGKFMRRARGAYRIGLPSQSHVDQCFRRLWTFHLSQTRMVAGLSNRPSWEVVGNRQGRPEQPGTTTGQPGWENAATRRTYSKTRPFVEYPFILFFFRISLSLLRGATALSRRLANTQLRLKIGVTEPQKTRRE